ncbi:nucleoside-diphosphate-sugar epimerase [Flavobacterium faecale]|uniref:Nucleoside-diphosphate-sugar epimerase n=1 Tax=Flavobacterium faecale TaxID=1355330 RepID=A0A2S1LCF6_9FLAO|nr:NAD-dependent epimerase/dehydratase family protein [Flavobacterium faecale]AWG21435.1 nucleoside-diphosphate-sugar epimerase [Flavobacterium faecale]
MKILITGGSGFVGSNLQNYLKDDYEIQPLRVRYVLNQKFDYSCGAVIHLAGKAHDLKKVSSPQEYYDANFELTKQLFDTFLISDATVFIFMSTVKAVSDQVKGVLTEESVADPKTHYGIAKHQAENYILSRNLPSNKRIYILRPCMIHGPGNKGNLNLLYQLVSKGIPWPLGNFQNSRSFLSIKNLCFVINEILSNHNIPSGIYNVSDNEPISTKNLINIIGESLGRKNIILNIPASFIKATAKMGDFLHLPINSERLQKLTENYVVCNKKVVKSIGKNLPYSSIEGLIETFNSFKFK